MKLASKLVGWSIDVRAEGQVEDALKKAEGLFAPKKPEGEVAVGEGAAAEEGAVPAGEKIPEDPGEPRESAEPGEPAPVEPEGDISSPPDPAESAGGTEDPADKREDGSVS